MTEVGRVTALEGSKAQVLIRRNAMCGECGACQIGKENMTMNATALNKAGARRGDQVLVEVPSITGINALLISYGIPLLFFLCGIALGWLIAPKVGIIFTVVTYFVIYFLEKRDVFKAKFDPVIVEVLSDEDVKALTNE